jgi:hypothetical protein
MAECSLTLELAFQCSLRTLWIVVEARRYHSAGEILACRIVSLGLRRIAR